MRTGKQYSIKMNYKTLSYLQMILHQVKHDGARSSDEKRRAFDQAIKAIESGIGEAYNYFLSKGTKTRVYTWEK